MVVCPYEAASVRGHAVVLVHDVDAGVDHDAGEHDHRREASLVKGGLREPECQEYADERDGYQRYYGQRLEERFEEYGAYHVDDHHYQHEQYPLVLGFLQPVVLRGGGLESYRQD